MKSKMQHLRITQKKSICPIKQEVETERNSLFGEQSCLQNRMYVSTKQHIITCV